MTLSRDLNFLCLSFCICNPWFYLSGMWWEWQKVKCDYACTRMGYRIITSFVLASLGLFVLQVENRLFSKMVCFEVQEELVCIFRLTTSLSKFPPHPSPSFSFSPLWAWALGTTEEEGRVALGSLHLEANPWHRGEGSSQHSESCASLLAAQWDPVCILWRAKCVSSKEQDWSTVDISPKYFPPGWPDVPLKVGQKTNSIVPF